ncbi:MAG: hypothetical protein ACPGGK_08560 [Pikeienuella sp.]
MSQDNNPKAAAAWLVGFVLIIIAASLGVIKMGVTPAEVALIGMVAFSAIVIAFAGMILWLILQGRIDLTLLVSEPRDPSCPEGTHKASLSRFQFLIFTFVIAGLYLMLSIEAGGFVTIPDNALYLIGLSGGGFVLSKGIGNAGKDKGGENPNAPKADDKTDS